MASEGASTPAAHATATTTSTTTATPNKYDIATVEEQQHLGQRFQISQYTRFFDIPGADIDHDVDAILSPPPKTGNNVVSPHMATLAAKPNKRRSQSRQYTGQFYSQLMKEWINIYDDEEGTPYYVSGEHAGYRE